MPFCNPDGKLLYFVHIPKTGGSSMEDYLRRRFGQLFLFERKLRPHNKGAGIIVQIVHLSSWDLEQVIPNEIDLVFGIVRDPLARIMSEYRWQSGASASSKMPFSTWLRIMISAARREPRVYGNHIRPMDELTPERTEVFRFEDGFEPVVARIDDVMGSSMPEMTIGHLKNRKDFRKIEVYRQDIELINDYYAADFARFGYERPEPGAYPSDPMAWLRDLQAGPLARLLVAKQRWSWCH
jgi:hypothetical protein